MHLACIRVLRYIVRCLYGDEANNPYPGFNGGVEHSACQHEDYLVSAAPSNEMRLSADLARTDVK